LCTGNLDSITDYVDCDVGVQASATALLHLGVNVSGLGVGFDYLAAAAGIGGCY
jgi:hypothetical protein